MSHAAATAQTGGGTGTAPAKTPPRSPSRSSAPSPPPYTLTEETPLLASHSQAGEGRTEHEEAVLLEPPQSETRHTKSWWFWRILWTLLAVLILAVFIKGWVDAKDVDVCVICCTSQCDILRIHYQDMKADLMCLFFPV